MVLDLVDKNLFHRAACPRPGHGHLFPWDSFAPVVAEAIPNPLLLFYMRHGLNFFVCTGGLSISLPPLDTEFPLQVHGHPVILNSLTMTAPFFAHVCLFR